MKVLKSDKILFCDVDDTLVMWKGTTYTPNQTHIEYIKRCYERDQMVVVWSAGGWKWAKKIVKELGLEPYVSAVMSKPAWWMDDLTADEILFSCNKIYLTDSEGNPK